jgi:hypothetical protein
MNETREELEAKYGKENVFNISELTTKFKIESFLAPYCFAERKSDGAKGHFLFQHSPRFYFDFKEH